MRAIGNLLLRALTGSNPSSTGDAAMADLYLGKGSFARARDLELDGISTFNHGLGDVTSTLLLARSPRGPRAFFRALPGVAFHEVQGDVQRLTNKGRGHSETVVAHGVIHSKIKPTKVHRLRGRPYEPKGIFAPKVHNLRIRANVEMAYIQALMVGADVNEPLIVAHDFCYPYLNAVDPGPIVPAAWFYVSDPSIKQRQPLMDNAARMGMESYVNSYYQETLDDQLAVLLSAARALREQGFPEYAKPHIDLIKALLRQNSDSPEITRYQNMVASARI